jgi:serine/arginine repetitive matrix protein 2
LNPPTTLAIKHTDKIFYRKLLSTSNIFILFLPFLFFQFSVRETHQIAQAQQEKNAKLREAFGISEYFVEGTSFDPDRKAKEDVVKSETIQKELAEKETEKANRKRYALVRTPSREKDDDGGDGGGHKSKEEKKKKKKKNRDG